MGGFPTGLFMIDAEHGGPKETADPLEKCWDRNGIFVGRKIFKEITKDE
jgi:hypothetical protein